MLAFNLNANLIAFMSNNPLATAHFVMKMNIHYQQLFAVSKRLTASQIVPHKTCFKEKLNTKNKDIKTFQNLIHKPMVYGEQSATSELPTDHSHSLFLMKWQRRVYAGALACLFSCIFQTFCINLHNFWTHNCFHMKFGSLM